ncbi:MAG TPA: DedA family protein [Candidatus Paceibacterota bacterium]
MLDWATNIIESSGYLGVFLGMFLENIFPPLPSELMMIFSGATAGKGDLNIILVILAGSIGSVIGLLPWFYLGKWFGRKRLKKLADKFGRFLTFSGEDIEKADKWFEKHGKKIVFFGRFLPAVRTLVAIPAAITEMKLWKFMLYAFLGSIVYDGAFAMLGYFVGDNDTKQLEKIVDIGTYIVLGLVVIWYIYRVITFKKKK